MQVVTSDEDRQYSQSVIEEIQRLRPRLKSNARVTVDNENVDCSADGFPRCEEYPTDVAYHFMVIEDS